MKNQAAADRGSAFRHRPGDAKRTTTFLAAFALCLTVLAGQIPAQVTAPESLPENSLPRDHLLVGAILNGAELGALEVIRIGSRFLIPLEPFAELAGASVRSQDDALRFETPIGAAELVPEDLRQVDDVVYLRQETIEEKLAARVVFDSAEFSLRFDLPWRPGRQAPEAGVALDLPQIERIPDVTPPDLSLSTVELDVYHSRSEDRERSNSSAVLNGRMFDGWWRIRYQNDLSGSQSLREYAWLGTRDDRLYLVGQQQVHLHPLLGGLQLTGVQVATTNQPLELFSRSTEARELLPRRVRPLSNIRGIGPPAGSAELRLDGTVVARQAIGLDGIYEFLDVALPSRQLSLVEVLVYERYSQVPVAIHQQTQSASDFLLPKGAMIHMGGLGREGNLLRDLLDSTEDGGLAGFYQWRYGVSDRFTVEAAVQQSADSRLVLAGFVSQLGPSTSMSLGVGSSAGGQGYDLMLEALRPSWRFLAQSRWTEAGFLSPDSAKAFSHFAEIGYRGVPRLKASLIGRSIDSPSGRQEFVLPAISWRPLDPLYLRARPDVEGDYRYDLSYRFGASGRLAVTVEDKASATLSFRPAYRYRFSLGANFGDGEPDRYSAILRRFGSGRRRASWTAGTLYASGETGYLAGVTLALWPGVLGRVELESDPLLLGPDGRPDRRALFGLSTDLAFSRGRFLPARTLSVRDDRGAIAGRIKIDAPEGFPEYPLEKVEVLLEGLPASQTRAGGTYFVGNLEAGLYLVELDRENLPIELTPERVSFVVEVAPAAVTRLDFVVRPEFGVSGQVTDDAGRRQPGLRLELFDGEGRKVTSAVTDRFGLYRIDALPIGRYVLRISPKSFPAVDIEPPSRPIEIADDFLFGQDLVLPAAAGGDGVGIEDERPTESPAGPPSPPPEDRHGAEAEARLPAASPPAGTPDPGSPAERVAAWARAWSEQRVDDYLGFYARSFRPPRGMARSEWEALRRTRLERPRFIDLEISTLEVETRGPSRVRVRFSQAYRSDFYRDQVQKSLVLVLEDRQWRVLEERVEETIR